MPVFNCTLPGPHFMKSVSLPILSEVKAAAEKTQGWPFLRLGFRPFYVGGTLAAALLVPLWVAVFLGALPLRLAIPALLWHAHEMLFGFAVAIIVGFLMTAGKSWTGLATPRGPTLGALALIWLVARLAAFTEHAVVYAAIDMALLPLVAGVFTTLLLRAKNYRNLPIALILTLLAVANLVFHLAVQGMVAVPAISPLYAALALIIMIESVIAGRVIPAFTMSANVGLKLETPPGAERLTVALTVIGLLLWVLAPAGWPGALILTAAGGMHVRRLAKWQPSMARKKPILWILHAAYAWIPAGLLLLALAQLGLIPVSAGVHALAVGATGGLIIGMVTRTARGHTGRPLTVSKAEVAAYGLVMTAALLRVVLPLLVPGMYPATLVMAAVVWSAAFLIYLWVYMPWLVSTRPDGKDG
jgi:uncharacterized protein involved in response to NO